MGPLQSLWLVFHTYTFLLFIVRKLTAFMAHCLSVCVCAKTTPRVNANREILLHKKQRARENERHTQKHSQKTGNAKRVKRKDSRAPNDRLRT